MFIRRETLVASFDIRAFLVPWKPRRGDNLASTWNQDLTVYAMFIAKDANTVSCVVIFIKHMVSVFNRGGQFYWWRKTEYPEKTTNLSQVTD